MSLALIRGESKDVKPAKSYKVVYLGPHKKSKRLHKPRRKRSVPLRPPYLDNYLKKSDYFCQLATIHEAEAEDDMESPSSAAEGDMVVRYEPPTVPDVHEEEPSEMLVDELDSARLPPNAHATSPSKCAEPPSQMMLGKRKRENNYDFSVWSLDIRLRLEAEHSMRPSKRARPISRDVRSKPYEFRRLPEYCREEAELKQRKEAPARLISQLIGPSPELAPIPEGPDESSVPPERYPKKSDDFCPLATISETEAEGEMESLSSAAHQPPAAVDDNEGKTSSEAEDVRPKKWPWSTTKKVVYVAPVNRQRNVNRLWSSTKSVVYVGPSNPRRSAKLALSSSAKKVFYAGPGFLPIPERPDESSVPPASTAEDDDMGQVLVVPGAVSHDDDPPAVADEVEVEVEVDGEASAELCVYRQPPASPTVPVVVEMLGGESGEAEVDGDGSSKVEPVEPLRRSRRLAERRAREEAESAPVKSPNVRRSKRIASRPRVSYEGCCRR